MADFDPTDGLDLVGRAPEKKLGILPEPIVSASVDGAITNRVEVKKRRKRGEVQYRRDPRESTFGGTICVCVSMPPEDLMRLRELAARLHIGMSQLVRDLVRTEHARHAWNAADSPNGPPSK